MYVCMHACMYIPCAWVPALRVQHIINIYRYVYTYVCMYVCMHACLYVYTLCLGSRSSRSTCGFFCASSKSCVCMYVCMYVCMCYTVSLRMVPVIYCQSRVCVCVCVCVWYTYTRVCTSMHIHVDLQSFYVNKTTANKFAIRTAYIVFAHA
jgi:hypothetical protein